MDDIINAQNLTKTFGNFAAVNGVTFNVRIYNYKKYLWLKSKVKPRFVYKKLRQITRIVARLAGTVS
jgi:hypothetical protein